MLSAALLGIYGLNSLLLTLLYRKTKKSGLTSIGDSGSTEECVFPTRAAGATEETEAGDLPLVTVQLPVYNERHVVKRLVDAAVKLDWPAARLEIQILDDSTDDTSQIISRALARCRAQGVTVALQHIRRPERTHFKAGALQYGLAQARGQFIAIFDADFIPPPDFLRKTIPLFAGEQTGCVQARWGHVNAGSSRLTQAQALGIDGHFVVEQAARHGVRAFLNFNGTAGVWRKRCMIEAGGWQGDTLTEDLDLSYRAQLRGWRILYQPEMVVSAELPVQIEAFKRQQFRWAKGSIQTARKLLPALWQSHYPLWLKVLGTLHLTNYTVHPLMLVNLLLSLPMTQSGSPLLLLTPLFTISAIGPPLLYWTAMKGRVLAPGSRLGRLLLLIALGTGLSLNNSQAVVEALLNIQSPFKRTPKFADTGRSRTWQSSSYALPKHPLAWLELLLALYALVALAVSIYLGIWWLVFWLLLYTAGYGYVAGLAFVQAWQTRTVRLETSVGEERF